MKHVFSKRIVAYCLIITTAITILTGYLALKQGYISDGHLITIMGFWGGELLLLCLKRILEGTNE